MRISGRRRLPTIVTAFVILGSALSAATPAAASERVVPGPGEHPLSDAQRKLALDTMSPQERDVHGQLFADDAPGLLVGYVRREFDVKRSADAVEITEIGGFDPKEPTAFYVPDTRVAAQKTGGKSGTKLLTSLVIYKTRSTSPYEWYVETYVDWGPKWGDTPGIDSDVPEDVLALAWAGNLYIHSTSHAGKYFTCPSTMTGRTNLAIWESDITPNVGVEYEFEDWSHCSGGVILANDVDWALGNGYIRETTWKNKTDNIASKYVHTYGSGTLTITLGSAPSITVGGTMSQKWSLALSLAFTH